jgi:GT2 family glycosyltransferase
MLSVIIVSYNTREMTLDCLRTLTVELSGIESEIWVVDNASEDGSAEAVRRDFPEVHLIASDKNLGFGAANNRGMERSKGDAILLLNSDAFPRPGAIAALLKYLEQHPDVGVAGPRLLNKDGSLQLSCFKFPSPARCWLENLWLSALFRKSPSLGDYRRWPHDSERVVEFVSGACLLVRRVVYEQVGGFDEMFFMYSEETDWQRRITDHGWMIAFTPAAEVMHIAGASGAAEPARISKHFFNSLDYYEWKHHGVPGLIGLRTAMITGSLMRLALWLLALLVPGKRRAAGAKAKLHAWLLWRQSTKWRLTLPDR